MAISSQDATVDPGTRANLVKAYDRGASDRDKGDLPDWRKQERERFLALLKEGHGRTLLEVGAGTGKDSAFFKDNGLQVISTDISPEMAGLCRAKGLPVCLVDFCHLAFVAESFDAVFASSCLLHVSKKELPGVLRDIRAVLKPAGLLFMGMYGGQASEGVWEDDVYVPKRFFSIYTDGQIQGIVLALFEILRFETLQLREGEPHRQSLILRRTG